MISRSTKAIDSIKKIKKEKKSEKIYWMIRKIRCNDGFRLVSGHSTDIL